MTSDRPLVRLDAAALGASLLLLLSSQVGRSQSVSVPNTLDGKAAYEAQCLTCHGGPQAGAGGFAPALEGKAFVDKWSAQGADKLRKYIATEMPPGAPGNLAPEIYERITQYLVSANRMETSGGGEMAEAGSRAVMGGTVLSYDAVYTKEMSRRDALLKAMRSVDEQMLRSPPDGDWLQYRRTDDSHGFSPLRQIDSSNVRKLTLAWSKALPTGKNGITPLVHDGVMFINSSGTVLALDASTGDTLWTFSRKTSGLGASSQPRGMTVFEHRLIVPTLDNHVLALDFATGALLWDYTLPRSQGLNLSAAPIVVRGKVIQGVSGCWMMVNPRGCRVVALDARTGAELWSFNTIPAPDEPGGDTWNGADADRRFGAAIWASGSYSPENDLVYFGASQTYRLETLMVPKRPVGRINSALYTDSTLAIDPDTGKLKWHYQHIERDVWDLDWAFERVLLTVNFKGKARRAVATMGKMGIADVLDARTGEYLFSYDTGMQNVVAAIDPSTGRKRINPAVEPVAGQPVHVCPSTIGVRNWPAASYDAKRALLFTSLTSSCMEFTWKRNEADWKAIDFVATSSAHPDKDGNHSQVVAIDLSGQRPEWSTALRAPQISALLATAGNIVFSGGRDRVFRAFDSASGAILWSAKLDNAPSSSPISFMAAGVQHVAVTTGGGSPNDLARASLTPELEAGSPNTTLWTFKPMETSADDRSDNGEKPAIARR